MEEMKESKIESFENKLKKSSSTRLIYALIMVILGLICGGLVYTYLL